MSKKKYRDLQPWLDYFTMLKEYEDDNYLQVDTKEHECYVTQPALHAMSDGNNPEVQMRDGSIAKTARRLRTYAAWKSTEGRGYVFKQFSIHVVSDDEKHEPLYTILLTQKHRLWTWTDKFDVVVYPKK